MLIWSQKVTDFHVFFWSEEARSHSVTVPQHHLVLNESTTTSGLLLWLLGIIIAFKNLWQLIHLSGCSAQRTGYQIQNTNEKGIVVCDNAALIAVWWITSCVINEHISLIFLCLLFCIHSLGELSNEASVGSYCDLLLLLLLLLWFRPALPQQQGHVWRHFPGGGETILCT